jgi:hypothetical protein
MTFNDNYALLERKFQEQVIADNTELGIESSYTPNFKPSGPVDFILIAMEPSTGVPSKGNGEASEEPLNFSWSVEDFILHYCIRNYLCSTGETYHLTDLAKGGMTTKLAAKQRNERYDRWYPLLEEELRLLAKPGKTRLIAIGNVVGDFLREKRLCPDVQCILHYTRRASGHRRKKIEPWVNSFPGYRDAVSKEDFDRSIAQVFKDANLESYIPRRPEGGKPYTLTESRKMLMFYYMNRFGQLKDDPKILLRQG